MKTPTWAKPEITRAASLQRLPMPGVELLCPGGFHHLEGRSGPACSATHRTPPASLLGAPKLYAACCTSPKHKNTLLCSNWTASRCTTDKHGLRLVTPRWLQKTKICASCRITKQALQSQDGITAICHPGRKPCKNSAMQCSIHVCSLCSSLCMKSVDKPQVAALQDPRAFLGI